MYISDRCKVRSKLHQNYLSWRHLRDNSQPTQPTFYRYVKAGINQAVDSLLDIDHKLQIILQLEEINIKGELRTIKEILIEIDKIFNSLLPEEITEDKPDHVTINIKSKLNRQAIKQSIDDASADRIIPLLSNLKELGLLNTAIALACLKRLSPQDIIEFCQFLPQKEINYQVALTIINKRRKTHYIGTLLPWTDFTNKETLLNILQSAPRKRWWLR